MKKKLVFVDDSGVVLMSAQIATQSLIDSEKVELLTFSNPLELIQEVEDGLVYDLLITDINMPEMNGLDMAQKLKSLPSVKAKPIIALTTEGSNDMKQKGKEIGLIGWITKPFTNDKLLSGIRRVLRV